MFPEPPGLNPSCCLLTSKHPLSLSYSEIKLLLSCTTMLLQTLKLSECSGVRKCEGVEHVTWAFGPWAFWKKLDLEMFQPYQTFSTQLGIHSWITYRSGWTVRTWLWPLLALESNLLRSEILALPDKGSDCKTLHRHDIACCTLPTPPHFNFVFILKLTQDKLNLKYNKKKPSL